MRETVKSLAMSLVSGIIFGVGVLVAVIVFDIEGGGEWKGVDFPNGITVFDHEVISDSQFLTVRGRVKNQSEIDWSTVNLVLEVFVGSTKVNECYENVNDFESGVTRNFEIVCRDASGSGLPDNISYKITVESATYYPET